jgi:hypothetical protein
MISEDGKKFTNHQAYNGKYRFFRSGRNLRILRDNNKWIALYIAYQNRKATIQGRTAEKLEGPWSMETSTVAFSGRPSQFFITRREDSYYLFQQMDVYHSDDLMNFPGEKIGELISGRNQRKFNPEIIAFQGNCYLATYDRNGVWLSKLKWVFKSGAEIADWQQKLKQKTDMKQEKRNRRRNKRTVKPAGKRGNGERSLN